MKGHGDFLEIRWRIFLPLFCSYLRRISGDRAENFTTVSPLQPQHMVQISAHLYCPGLRSIFEGEGSLNSQTMV